MNDEADIDAVVLVSFGGPEGPDDVIPFLQNVTAGRNIPPERLAVVGRHYDLFGGVSPINQHNRELLSALRGELDHSGIDLPLYWGNRNWHPLLDDTFQQMADDGRRRVLAIVTSAFGSPSGCRQYLDDIVRAAGRASGDMSVLKARLYWNHPGFLDAVSERISDAFAGIADERRSGARLVFTAHSVPAAWTATSPYLPQLKAAAAKLAAGCAPELRWDLVFQSRSGPPHVPWLEPDIGDHLRSLAAEGVETAIVVPIGFVSDHMEVIYDLDTEAAAIADELEMTMVRAGTAGTHPAFVGALRQLVQEQLAGTPPLAAVGEAYPNPCPADCCSV